MVCFLIQTFFFILIRNLEVGELGVINKIMDGKINSEILICGASRAFVGIDTKVISGETNMSCFSIALNGSRMSTQVPLLKAYLKHNSPPKILIQEVGMYSLSLDEKIYAPYKYLPYLSEDELYNGLKKIDPNIWLNKYVPVANMTYFNTDFQRQILEDYSYQLNDFSDYLVNGFHPNNEKWTFNEEDFFKRRPGGLYNRIQDEGIGLLKEIIYITKKKSIKLFLVNTPEYYKILPLQNNREKIISVYKQIAKENGLEYLDYTEHEMTKDRSNFYNFTHLNLNGAYKFSKKLASDIVTFLKLNNILTSCQASLFF